MRRPRGSGLTRNEQKVLAAALRLATTGRSQLFGYEVFRELSAWEGATPMNHGTIYRCLRALEERDLLARHTETADPEYRVFYELTSVGVTAARRAVIQLAALDAPPSWLDVGLALAVLPDEA